MSDAMRDILKDIMSSKTTHKDGTFTLTVTSEHYERAKAILDKTNEKGEMPFIFYFFAGRHCLLYGRTVEEAFGKQYGGGALAAVDFYEQEAKPSHTWDANKNKWVSKRKR